MKANRWMRLQTSILAVVPCLFAHVVSANTIINGDFENNTAAGTAFNLSNAQFNSTVADATAFGEASEIDLINGNPYGLLPQSGNWKLAIHRSSTGNNDTFTFNLSAPIVAGQTYTLDFYAQAVTVFDAGNGAVQVGVSSSATSFGSLVFSGVPSTAAWTHFSQDFVSPVNGSCLSVQTDPNAAPTWNHIDNFSLTPVPEPAALTLLAVGFAATVATRRKNVS
jgi:hypothetical protein